MKNLTLMIAILLFALGVLTVSVVNTSALTESQNYKISPLTDVSKKITPETIKKIDYFLAYPGILPDHFLYPVKMIRDRVWLWLTTNSLKKAELLLLFADKRLGAGKALIERNKIELGVSTITKAEKYLEQAISQEKIARERGEQTTAFLEKLSLATLKHEEVLLGLNQNIPETLRSVLDNAIGYARRGYEEVRMRLGND